MKIPVTKTTIDRKTGQVVSEKVVGYKEVNQDEHLAPLVEVFFEDFMNKFYEEQSTLKEVR